MLSIEGLCKSYGPFPVLDNVSFSITGDMHVGLVGANGAGKSTLLKIIAGREVADDGRVSIESGKTVGYLPQMLTLLPGQTIAELVYESTGELRRLGNRMQAIEKIMSAPGDILSSDLLDEYGEISLRFEERGGYDLEYRTDIVMEGLGLGYLEKTRPVATLSGGEKTRLGLAILLLRSPDILLLDEPTNNLDDKYLEWLEGYLNSYRGAVIMVSHDRQFLNTGANWIYEIDEHQHALTRYRGNYDDFKAAKDRAGVKWEEDYRQQQEEIKELKRVMRTTASGQGRRQKSPDNDKLVFNFKGERLQGTASRTIRAARQRLTRIMEDPVPKPPRPLRFKVRLVSDGIRSAEVIRAERLSKGYDGNLILQDVSLTLGADSRVVITGPNGSGKTTLLRLLSGKEKPDSGVVTWAPGVRLGYLPQEPDGIQPRLTLLEYFRSGLTGYDEDFIFNLVTCGLFKYDEINKTLEQLSIGQIRKLEIARLIAAEPNVLILDEPTNHISLDILESFEAAITCFRGPVLAVSHDRRFIRKFGREVREITEAAWGRDYRRRRFQSKV